MARSRYQTIFTISADDKQGLELLEDARALIGSGVAEQFGELDVASSTEGEWKNDQGKLRIDSEVREGAGFFSLLWERLDGWHLRWRLATLKGEVEADVQVSGPDNDTREAGPPSALEDILNRYRCRIQGYDMWDLVQGVSKENADWYADSVIFNPERRIPVVAISPASMFEGSARFQRAHMLLRGIAAIVVPSGHDLPVINNKLGRLACSGGEVRVYQPGATREDDPSLHRKWRPNEVDWGDIRDECMQVLALSQGPRLYHEVREEIVRLWEEDQPEENLGNLSSSAQIRRLESELAEERDARSRAEAERDHWKALSEKTALDVASANDELASVSASVEGSSTAGTKRTKRKADAEHRAELEKRDDRIQDLEFALSQKDARIGYLEQRVDELSEMAGGGNRLQEKLPPEADDNNEFSESLHELKSVSEVVLNAQKLPGLRFLDSAFSSANDSPYKYLDRLDRAFTALSEYAEIQIAGQPLRMSSADWFQQKGLDYVAHESQQAMQEHGRDFTDDRCRTNIAMPEHIRFGGGGNRDPKDILRIHFAWCRKESLVLIGHVGRHLDVVTS